jgi:hypothetical protein
MRGEALLPPPGQWLLLLTYSMLNCKRPVTAALL